jgi:hypothetical protein
MVNTVPRMCFEQLGGGFVSVIVACGWGDVPLPNEHGSGAFRGPPGVYDDDGYRYEDDQHNYGDDSVWHVGNRTPQLTPIRSVIRSDRRIEIPIS